jgi:hypothetical protein
MSSNLVRLFWWTWRFGLYFSLHLAAIMAIGVENGSYGGTNLIDWARAYPQQQSSWSYGAHS